jgi:CRISPR-associated endonuclease Csn1
MNNTTQNIHLAFDVGHNSIGWSVLKVDGEAPEIAGCGAVIFQKDGCLATKRRDYRRQRRNIRATRQRIARLKQLIFSLGVLSHEQLNRVSSSSPWHLAAGVLEGNKKLNWPELWDVMRWYAHNRGYDGNRQWATNGSVEEEEDTEKVENARGLFAKHGTKTMAQTLCAELELDAKAGKASSRIRFKGLSAAFPRENVTSELRMVLEAHNGQLPMVDDALIRALIGTDHSDRDAWKAVTVLGLKIPNRFHGSLLMGQNIPRFDNRIIARCTILFDRVFQQKLDEGIDRESAQAEAQKMSKVPSKKAPEFLQFRWAMLLANVLVTGADGKARPLSVEEREAVHLKIRERGAFTPTQFKIEVMTATGGIRSNLEEMLSHPDADKALVFDYATRETQRGTLGLVWPSIDELNKKRIKRLLRDGKKITIGEIVAGNESAINVLQNSLVVSASRRTSAKAKPATKSLDDLLSETVHIPPLKRRAPFSRQIMKEVVEDVMVRGIHPAAEGGVLYRGESIRLAQVQRRLDEQTNNHLVRHRLLILERLHHDLLEEYADGNPDCIGRITIEVNSDLREMSGKNAKEAAQEEGRKLADFKGVTKILEKQLDGLGIQITAGLIRKARVAHDQGWKCLYTGKDFDVLDLVHRRVDKDHIIPRSLRQSDSLDSLVITFSEVNRMKGPRTAVTFIEEFAGKVVEGRPELSIMSPASFEGLVNGLDSRHGHEDDKRRKKNRKRLLMLKDYVDKEFTPGDLTRTSQLVRLGAQLLERPYLGSVRRPVITSLPGSVTGAVRKSWRVLGCLSKANPAVTAESTKTDVRSITHLHHALDASVMALASHFLPRDGGIWELIVKRKLSPNDQQRLLDRGRQFARDSEGRVSLIDLPSFLKNQLSERLAEQRVVQHIASDMSGLASEETVYRVLDPTDTHPSAKKLMKLCAAKGIEIPDVREEVALLVSRKRRSPIESGELLHETPTWRWSYRIEKKSKLLGLESREATPGKLKSLKAVKIIGENFGLALDPEPEVLQLSSVWKRLKELRQAHGRAVRILRNGDLITLLSEDVPEHRRGNWRVMSVKNSKNGVSLDLGRADQTAVSSQSWREVRVSSLLRDGMKILKPRLTGSPKTTK